MANSKDDRNGEFIVDGVIKFYISGKYGFVTPADTRMSDVFVHESVLRQSGFAEFAPGMRVVLRVVLFKQRLRAIEVLDLKQAADPSSLPWCAGTIVDFDPIRGFGWVEIGKSFQIFIHARELRHAGLRHLRNGDKVEVQWSNIKAGPTVSNVRLPVL